MARLPDNRVDASHLRIDALYKLIFLSLISVLLLILEPRVPGIKAVRTGVNYGMAPLQIVVDWVVKQQNSWSLFLDDKEYTSSRITAMEKDNLLLNVQLNSLRQTANDNDKLKKLLDYQERATLSETLYVARVIGGQTNGINKQIIFDLGKIDGIEEGMVVRSATGLLGQVVSVGLGSGKALLVTDPQHSVPVQVARSDSRFILDGLGKDKLVHAIDLHADIDVRNGDVLITSGLGGRFPPGIPVAQVSEIISKEKVSLRDLYARPLGKANVATFIIISEGLNYPEELTDN